MGGRHGAHGTSERTPTRVLLVMGVLLVGALVGMLLLRQEAPAPSASSSVEQVDGTVVGIDGEPCATDDPAAGGEGCGVARVEIADGQVVPAQLPVGVGAPTLEVDDEVVLSHSPENPEGMQYAVVDMQRSTQLWLLLGAFALSVLAFGRWRGLAALVGLGVTFTVILGFVVPAILGGSPPVLVAVVGCSAIMLTVLYLTHGLSRTTTVAVCGTLVSLVITGLLSTLAVTATHLSGALDESSMLLGETYDVDLRGLLLAGILIGSLGVLDDVTVTQAATVEELAVANPRYRARDLYRAATRVGRAHIASVINTIVLAYAGASLPLLVLVVAVGDPLGQVLSDELIATELVRSAVGTIGLIAAVPITTALAALVAERRGRAGRQDAADRAVV